MLLTHEPMRAFGHFTPGAFGGHPRSMPMDTYRRGNDVLLHLDLPGVDPESIELTVERHVLSVTAHRVFDRIPISVPDDAQQAIGAREHAGAKA